jgi:glycogen(starch) synthase
MRVAITTPFFPPHPGGLERHVFELAEGLAKRGFEAYIITSDILAPEREPDVDFEIIRLPSRRIGFDCLVSGLRRKFREIDPDIVHSHAPLSLIASMTSKIIKHSRPLVCTYHGDYYKKAAWENVVKHFRNHFQLPITLHYPRYTIALTEYDRRLLNRYGIDDGKIRVIYPGIEIDAYRSMISANRYDTRKILYVGRVVYEKGIRELLVAFGSLVKRVKGAELVIAGTGYALEDMKRLARDLGIAKKVGFLGWVEHDDIPGLFNEAAFLVLPSFSEGLPYVVLEAMASGQAIVASDVSGMNEAIVNGRSGLLYDVNEEGALLDAMTTLIKDPDRCRKMGRFGLEHCTNNFSNERWLTETVRTYEEIS